MTHVVETCCVHLVDLLFMGDHLPLLLSFSHRVEAASTCDLVDLSTWTEPPHVDSKGFGTFQVASLLGIVELAACGDAPADEDKYH